MALEFHSGLSARESLTIARILRVNHAGEYGAIRIYSAQIRVAKRWFPDVVPALADMLSHERQHCAAFLAAMPTRGSRPCRIMSLWSLGGWLLGAPHRDPELHAIILSIRGEELSHLRHAEGQLHAPGLLQRKTQTAISVITDVLIWLSTWGDSTRMARELRLANPAH
jgi:ubiquinone biosynthesis monooxygenase Coq7